MFTMKRLLLLATSLLLLLCSVCGSAHGAQRQLQKGSDAEVVSTARKGKKGSSGGDSEEYASEENPVEGGAVSLHEVSEPQPAAEIDLGGAVRNRRPGFRRQ